jgi:hypothetical protein
MLSLIACYSMYLAFPLWVFSWGVADEGQQIGARRLPKLRPGLWTFTTLVALLAVDFKLLIPGMPSYGYWLYVVDAAVLLIPLLIGVVTRVSVWDLWTVAIIVGLLGILTSPATGVR